MSTISVCESSLPRCNRKIFIGDVHGCYDELQQLLLHLEHDCNYDELYFVGDLVNKGPKSNQVIDFVRNTKNCYSVMGNHDYSVIRKQKKTISTENIEYLKCLPYYLYADENKNILVCHAGIVPNPKIKIIKQNQNNLMKIRHIQVIENEMIASERDNIGKPWISYYNGFNGHIFFGHDAKKLLQIGMFATGLDTGCCYGNFITAAVVKCDDKFKLFHDYRKQESCYKIMEWENNAKLYISATPTKFIYRLYSETSYQPKTKSTIKPSNYTKLELIDQLIANFS